MRQELEFGKKIEIKLEPTGVSTEGIMQIDDFMHKHYDFCIIPFNDSFEPVNRDGRFSVRLSKWLHNNGVEISKDDLSKVGNMYNDFRVKGRTLHIDFCDNMDWNAGAFGDPESCFWKSKKHNRLMFQRAGGYCVRFYVKDGNEYRGYARALLMDMDNNKTVLFNSYGMETREAAQTLSEWWKKPLAKAEALRSHDNQGNPTDFFFNKAPYVIGSKQNQGVIDLLIPQIGKCGDCKVCGKLTDVRFHADFACLEHHDQLNIEWAELQAKLAAAEEEAKRLGIERNKDSNGRWTVTLGSTTGSSTMNARYSFSTTPTNNNWYRVDNAQPGGVDPAAADDNPARAVNDQQPVFGRPEDYAIRPRNPRFTTTARPMTAADLDAHYEMERRRREADARQEFNGIFDGSGGTGWTTREYLNAPRMAQEAHVPAENADIVPFFDLDQRPRFTAAPIPPPPMQLQLVPDEQMEAAQAQMEALQQARQAEMDAAARDAEIQRGLEAGMRGVHVVQRDDVQQAVEGQVDQEILLRGLEQAVVNDIVWVDDFFDNDQGEEEPDEEFDDEPEEEEEGFEDDFEDFFHDDEPDLED